MSGDKIQPARLRERFCYNPETGVLSYRATGQGTVAGRRAGYVHTDNRQRGKYRRAPRMERRVEIDGRKYREHHVIFAWMTGRWPQDRMDHRNGDSLDNRWENLREATLQENRHNTSEARPNGRLRGVFRAHWTKRELWYARIRVDGVEHYLGSFPTGEEAHARYCAAARLFHEDFFCERPSS